VTTGQDPLALTERHQLGRVGGADDFPTLFVNELGGSEFDTRSQEGLATLRRFDEANVLRVGLVPGAQTEPLGFGAYLIFVQVPNGQEQHVELLGGQVPQHVGLVLGGVGSTSQPRTVVAASDLSVMTSSHGIKAQPFGTFEEQIKLDMTIALNAGIRA
jgi:hypothetical protein